MNTEYEDLTFERLGHSSVKITSQQSGKNIYIDPWSEVVENSPSDADYVIVTHDDFDHYDPEAIKKVSNPETKIMLYREIDSSEFDSGIESIDIGETINLDSLKIQALPAYNLEDGDHVDEEGLPFHQKGEGMGILLNFEEVKILYLGDTDFIPEHQSLTAEVIIPPIGGHYTMNRHDAVDLVEAVRPRLVLPVHYNTFEQIETDAKGFKEEIQSRGIKIELF